MYESSSRESQAKTMIGLVFLGIIAIMGLIILFGSMMVVDEGERAVITRVGKVERVLAPGFHFKMPLFESGTTFQVRTQKIETEATAASRDLQDVTTNVAVQYSLMSDRVADIYSQYQTENNLRSREIDPAIQDIVKAAAARYNAEELITKRAEVKDAMIVALKERLSGVNVEVTNLDIINFSFSESFALAIEEKVTAEQNASREENRLREIEFRAQQTIETAKAEAEAIRIQADAINSQGGADYVNLKAIEKWNGQLPTQFVPGSAVPFINL